MIDQVTIIIRSVGERTEELCKQLILDQGVPEKNLFIIREKPFSKAMRVGYQRGIDNGLKWTYCIDADVLLRDNAIHEMLAIAEEQPEEVFTISARMIDKFFNIARRVGNHLFRSSDLTKLIKNISPYEKEGIRPETDAKNKLIAEGGIEHKSDKIIGIHDFEQHYFDIARKAFVHANKHTELLGDFVPFWKEYIGSDDDFKAALIGLSEGLKFFDDVKIDSEEYNDLRKAVNKKFSHKKTDSNSFTINSSSDINKIINRFKEENKYRPPYSYDKLYRYFKAKLKFDIKSLLSIQ